MDVLEKEQLVVYPVVAQEPEIGRWLWMLQDARQRTLKDLKGLTQQTIDWLPPDEGSSIGTILYHIALIEADWFYVEVLQQPYPAEVQALLSHTVRNEQELLTQVRGFSLAQHLERLGRIRHLLLATYQTMTLEDFRRPRALPNYDVTPEWVLHHLMQHEAEHRSQMGSLRIMAEQR